MYYYFIMAALIIGAYMFGNINISIIISKIKNRDVRKVGSGNPGTMNMLRSFGIKLGALTLVLDAVKGAVPAIIGWYLLGRNDLSSIDGFCFGPDKIGLYIGGISAVLGHIFPVVFKFKGGKGVATSIGVCFVACWWLALIAFAIGLIFFFTVKIGSLTSFIMTGIPLIYCGVTAIVGGSIIEGVLALAIYIIVLAAHHANIVRLFKGQEKQIILFGKNKSAKVMQEAEAAAAAEQSETEAVAETAQIEQTETDNGQDNNVQ